MKYLIGLDIGTSSVKGVLMSINGNLKSCKTQKHNYILTDGFKTLDAEDFCQTCFGVIRELANEISDNDKIIAICSSGASGNLLFVKAGMAATPVYGWQNNYDGSIIDEVLSDIEADHVYHTVGWGKIKSFPLAALAYFKQTDPELIFGADMICMHIEYLNYRMTGNWGITPSMGTPFYLINQETEDYEPGYLETLGINKSQLPKIMPNCSVLGNLNEYASQKTGLEQGIPIILGTFDHPSAARGAGVLNENEVLISCGTSWVVLVPYCERCIPQSKRMMTDPFMNPNGNWCGMKSMESVSDTIDRYIKKYLGDISFAELDALADEAPIGANGLIIDADTDVSGYSRNDIARAIMESIARGVDDFLKTYAEDAEIIRLVGGITNSKVWCRVISEITGKNVSVVNGEHAGAVGAAIMAGVGVGEYKNEADAFEMIYREVE